MNNNISNGLLIFRAALTQFGDASYQLARETVKIPFYDGWRWMAVTGLPVLLLVSGTGAVIFAVATKSIRAVGNTLYSNTAKVIKIFYIFRSVTPLQQNTLQQSNPPNPPIPFLSRLFQPSPNKELQSPSAVVSPSAPLPIDAAKERNKSLIKLSALIEKFVIDPSIKKKDLLVGVTYTEEELKKWLMSMTLGYLGIMWDKLENEYVHWKTPPPPTTESIINEARQIDPHLAEMFQKSIQLPEGDQISHDNRILAVWKAVEGSALLDNQKATLVALYLKLDAIFKKSPVSNDSKIAEAEEIRKKFASLMNDGMANTLSHMAGMIEGWIGVLNNPPVILMPAFPVNALIQPVVEDNANSISKLVKNASHRIQEDLPTKYLMPLWRKKYAEWDASVIEDLKKKNSQIQIKFFDDFMNGNVDEKTFLEDLQSHSLSTSLTSKVFFMRAVRYMGHNQKHFEESTHNILVSLLAQLEPTLIDTLTKSADMLSHVSFERAIPKLVNHCIKLLNCCTTMHTVRQEQQESSKLESSSIAVQRNDDSPFIGVLKKAGVKSDTLHDINQLYKDISTQISGRAIIQQLPEKSVHEVVRCSLDSSLYEEGWIREKKEQLRTVLRLRAEKYARKESNWLSSLLKTNPIGQPTNLVSTLLAFSTKLSDLPGLKGVMTFLFSGIESVLENQGCDAVQLALNEFTSTGYLSTNISTSLVKGLLYKEEEEWNKNLPKLQQAYLFLQPTEQKKVLKHLAAQCDGPTFEQRKAKLESKAELENSKSISIELAHEVEKIKKRENAYKAAADAVDKAIGVLNDRISTPDQQDADQQDVSLLEKTYEKLNREKELQQFYRMRTLVIYVADEFFQKTFTFIGGTAVKDLFIRVIHEVLNLLTYQEIIKHWIFTIVDLVIKELKQSSDSKQVANSKPTDVKSLFDLISVDEKRSLLYSLSCLMDKTEANKTEQNEGWLSSSVSLIVRKATKWAPGLVWDSIEKEYNEKTKITPLELTKAIIERLDKFGKDPNGLSDVVIQLFTEHFADHRNQLPDETIATKRKSRQIARSNVG